MPPKGHALLESGRSHRVGGMGGGAAGPEDKPREHRSEGESRKGDRVFLWEVWEGGEATSDKVAQKAFLNRERTECSRHHLCKGPVAEPSLCV